MHEDLPGQGAFISTVNGGSGLILFEFDRSAGEERARTPFPPLSICLQRELLWQTTATQ